MRARVREVSGRRRALRSPRAAPHSVRTDPPPRACLGVGNSGLRVSYLGFGDWGVGFKVLGIRFEIWDLGFRVQDFGFRTFGSGFRVQGLGCRVQDLRLRVNGIEFGV